jgi:hypothetical protein
MIYSLHLQENLMPWYSNEFVLEHRAIAITHHTCPQCLAPPGVACLRKRDGRARKAQHGPRFDLAIGRTPRDHTVDRTRGPLPQRLYEVPAG